MAKISGRRPGRAAARLAAAAITAALVCTGASAFAAEAGDAPMFGLVGLDKSGAAYYYAPNGVGGLTGRVSYDSGWKDVAYAGRVDNDADSVADGRWQTDAKGNLLFAANDNSAVKNAGHGWNIYNTLLSAGDLGGAGAGDLLGRDSKGFLFLYLGYGNGTVATRYKVGGGWDAYTRLAGNGDLTGDGKNDIVARDKAGVLWLYRGTGNYKAPFAKRTEIGRGWNAYNALVSTGDIDMDGKADLLARDTAGVLYLYKGTGVAGKPYASRVVIGTGGWNTYRLLF